MLVYMYLCMNVCIRAFSTTFLPPVHFSLFEGVRIPRFCPRGEEGRTARFSGAEGAVLENFRDFSEKLFVKNEMKSENLGIWG